MGTAFTISPGRSSRTPSSPASALTGVASEAGEGRGVGEGITCFGAATPARRLAAPFVFGRSPLRRSASRLATPPVGATVTHCPPPPTLASYPIMLSFLMTLNTINYRLPPIWVPRVCLTVFM